MRKILRSDLENCEFYDGKTAIEIRGERRAPYATFTEEEVEKILSNFPLNANSIAKKDKNDDWKYYDSENEAWFGIAIEPKIMKCPKGGKKEIAK